MNPFRALVLGAVQGATEFIPVSSSGHLVLVPAALRWELPGLAFTTLLHGGTLVSLLVYFRADLLPLAGIRRGSGGSEVSPRTLLWMVVATGVTAVIAFPFHNTVETLFESPRAAAAFLLATGGVLLLAEGVARGRRGLGEMRLRDAVVVGVGQALAVAPGLSRSGMTIASGLVGGLRRETAARFAFLVSIPAIAGAALVELPKAAAEGWTVSPASCIVGFVSAAISGYVGITLVMDFVQRQRLKWFAGYCLVVGVVALVLLSRGRY